MSRVEESTEMMADELAQAYNKTERVGQENTGLSSWGALGSAKDCSFKSSPNARETSTCSLCQLLLNCLDH